VAVKAIHLQEVQLGAPGHIAGSESGHQEIQKARTVNGWRDCILVLMDLIGVKKRALEGDSAASGSMQAFHQLVRREMSAGLNSLHHAYVWNDSVLLLAYADNQPIAYAKVMRAADELKRRVDGISPCYAIAVKGRAFHQHLFPKTQELR
jgi:hypothetical protein